MSKSDVDGLIKYLNNTSLFEKQQILDVLLKDFRLENHFKKFYEEELKKDKQKLKDIVKNEVSFEYEGKILLLKRDNESLQKTLDNTNNSYKIQLDTAKKVLEIQLEKVNDSLKKEVKDKEQIKKTYDLVIKNLESEIEKEKKISLDEKNKLEDKIKNMNIALKANNSNITFMNSAYFLLNEEYVSTTISSNLLYLELELAKEIEKITGLKNIGKSLNFKNHLYEHILTNYTGTIITETVVSEIFSYYKSLNLMVFMSGKKFNYRPFDLLKEEVFNIESFYTQILKEEGDS